MKDFTRASLNSLAVQWVGNKSKDEDIKFSKALIPLDDEGLMDVLFRYFTTSFRSEDYFCFGHDTDLNMNELYTYCSEIFSDPETLYQQSINIAKHLYNQQDHPKIKAGELYVAYFQD